MFPNNKSEQPAQIKKFGLAAFTTFATALSFLAFSSKALSQTPNFNSCSPLVSQPDTIVCNDGRTFYIEESGRETSQGVIRQQTIIKGPVQTQTEPRQIQTLSEPETEQIPPFALNNCPVGTKVFMSPWGIWYIALPKVLPKDSKNPENKQAVTFQLFNPKYDSTKPFTSITVKAGSTMLLQTPDTTKDFPVPVEVARIDCEY